jgi:uncharacterized damage-inducible protein DinB
MTPPVYDPKGGLQGRLQRNRDILLWKLDGLSEYDVRRPLVRTGTNLLGLVKHMAFVEAGYFGDCFGRPVPDISSDELEEANADMWARPNESRDDIVNRYRRVWQHADATISELPLDAPARVPWWPEERRDTTLHYVLVHVVDEIARHAGHADIVRELIDGAAGVRAGSSNLPDESPAWWASYREKVEQAARQAGGAEG